jgi:hypothetical protein
MGMHLIRGMELGWPRETKIMENGEGKMENEKKIVKHSIFSF